jgi:hypothetical protein
MFLVRPAVIPQSWPAHADQVAECIFHLAHERAASNRDWTSADQLQIRHSGIEVGGRLIIPNSGEEKLATDERRQGC